MRKKLLVLTPRLPYPVIGGDRLRIYEVCKELCLRYELTLLSLCESEEEMHLLLPDDGVFNAVERVLLPRWRSYMNCLVALPSMRPLQVAYYQSAEFQTRVDALLDNHDAILCHLIRTTEYALYSNKPFITEFTDAISLNYLRVKELAKSGGIKNLIYSLEQTRLEKYEKRIGRASALNVFVSDIDADHLFPAGSPERGKTTVCSNGVDVEAYPFKPDRHSKEIAFIGNMQSVQNMDAALWFAKLVMPHLAPAGFTFKIVGRISDSNRARLNSYPKVVATGGVDSVVTAVEQSFVGVCPMRIGAGVQNKILEYMALGLPCVSSSLGYEGLHAVAGRDLYVLDSPEEIADVIRALYTDRATHRLIALSGRKYVEQHHSWSAKLKPLSDAIDFQL